MKNKIAAYLCLVLTALAPCYAREIYLSIDSNRSNEVYRIKTNNESEFPIGLCFTEESSVFGYFIDGMKNHHFIKANPMENTEFKTKAGTIFRQAYDGDINPAEIGQSGNKTIFDSRDSLIPGEKGRAIYRTKEAVFSAGTGKKV